MTNELLGATDQSSGLRVVAFYRLGGSRGANAASAHVSAAAKWLRITEARPDFVGHDQPHVPSEIGSYTASDVDVVLKQAALAASFGIDAFCYFCEWTGDTTSARLEIDALKNLAAAFPFCVCWENGITDPVPDTATRQSVPRRQYSVAESLVFFRTLLPLFVDRYYLRVNGRPLFIVAMPELLNDLPFVIASWREECVRGGSGDPYLVGVGGVRKTLPGFDATIELPPLGFPPERVLGTPFDHSFHGDVRSYRSLVAQLLGRARPTYKLLRTAMPGWDSATSEPLRGVTFVGSSPEAFAYWVERIAREATLRLAGEERLIFIRSWNEWDTGCHLEPDERYGRQYLAALRDGIEQGSHGAPARPMWPIPGSSERGLAHTTQTRIVRSSAQQPIVTQGPSVSVVMPAYNHERFVKQTLDSILAQTHGNLEIIVVDDGSLDATGEVLDAYARCCITHPLMVVHRPNTGAHDAINHGLALARGDVVALINSDDLYAPTRLERCLGAMTQRNAAFAFSDISFIDEDGEAIGSDAVYVTQLRNSIAQGFRAPDPVYALIKSNIAISSGNFVFNRRLLEATGGFCALRVCHDWDFILGASYYTALAVVDEPLYLYRMHGANTFVDRGLSTRLEIEQLLSRFFHDIDRHPLLAEARHRELFLRHVRDSGLAGYLQLA